MKVIYKRTLEETTESKTLDKTYAEENGTLNKEEVTIHKTIKYMALIIKEV